MKKSCMNCAMRRTVTSCATGKVSYRCAYDMDMKVNRRMWCEAWKETTVRPAGPFAISIGGITTEKTRHS